MGWFLLIITNILTLAITITVISLIFNLIYKIGNSAKLNSVISLIVSLVMFIILLCMKEGPEFYEGEFQGGSTGTIGMASIALSFPMANMMVANHDGDDVFSGIGQSIFSLGGLTTIAIIILCFADTYWPLTVLSGIGVLTSVITFFKN